MNISCICKYCKHRNIQSSIQIDFSKQTVFYVCPQCKKDNQIKIRQQPKALPRIMGSRR